MLYRFLIYCQLLIMVFLTGCVQSSRGTPQDVPFQPTEFIQPTVPIQTVEIMTATPPGPTDSTAENSGLLETPPTGEPAVAGQWVEYRDPRYGIGLAIPCWWTFSPLPAEGMGGTMSIRSYDDDYFFANSTKGWWTAGDWPEGALKVDLSVWQEFEPTLNTLEAFRTTFDHESSAIASTQEVRIGENEAMLVEMQNLVNTADPNSRLYVFRLSADSLIMVSAAPDRALFSADVQALLNSLSLAPEKPVVLPAVAPSPAIIPLPAGCPSGG